MFLPKPVASLGRVVRDVVWMNGILYAAIGPNVVAFEAAAGSDLKFLSQTEPLPGVVLDLAAGDGVVYAAHLDPWGGTSPGHVAEDGGLAVVSLDGTRRLRVTGRVVLTDGRGYGALAWADAKVVALKCDESACDGLDVIDVSSPGQPLAGESVQVDLHDLGWPPTALVALGAGLFTDGWSVLDVNRPRGPSLKARLEAPGYPVGGHGYLATVTYDEIHLYRSIAPEIPQLVASEKLGYNVTTAAAMDGGLLIGGPALPRQTGDAVGGWFWLPVIGDTFGLPEPHRDGLIPRGYASGDGETWVAMNRWFEPYLGISIDPFTPSIGRLRHDGAGRPVGDLSTEWTGWDWQTTDVLLLGDVAYVLSYPHGPDDQISLLVYDVSEPARPALIGSLAGVCRSTASAGQMRSYRDCSSVPLDGGRLLLSSAHGASVVDVRDSRSPVVIETGPSLGVQLTTVPGGVLAIAVDQLVMYDASGPGWPAALWAHPLGIRLVSTLNFEAWAKLATSSAGGSTLVAVVGWTESQHQALWTGWVKDGDSPVGATLMPNEGGLAWPPGSLVAYEDRLFLARAQDTPVGTLEEYRMAAEGPLLESNTTLPEVAVVFDAIVVDGLLLMGSQRKIDAVRISGDNPRWLGSVPYARGLPTDEVYTGLELAPRLIPVTDDYFYVTGHVMSQAWEMP